MADIKLKNRSGTDVTYTGVKTIQVPKADGTKEDFINPQGNINITDTQITDVRGKATAQVVDANLVAENIAKDVTVLGITGTHEGGGGGEFPQLHAPTISIDEDTLTITNPSNNGDFVTGYKILNNGAEVATVTDTTVDLTAVFTEANDYTVTVKAIGTNFVDSVDSNAVAYTNIFYSVTYNLTNCTSNNTATQVRKNGSYKATITAESGYAMSSGNASITMGGSVLSGVYANGKIEIPSVTGELVITAKAGQKYIITAGSYVGKSNLTEVKSIQLRTPIKFYNGGGDGIFLSYNSQFKPVLYYDSTSTGGNLSWLGNKVYTYWSWNQSSFKINDTETTKEYYDAFNYYFEPQATS